MAYSTTASQVDTSTKESPDGVESGQGGELLKIYSGYKTSGTQSDSELGDAFTATFLDKDGLPLSGVVTIFRGEEPVSTGEVSGLVSLPGPVPRGVTSGSNIEESEGYNAVFEPSITGANYVQENYVTNPPGEVQYGSLTGTVTDVDGEPVADDTVEAPGLTAVTDESGEYDLVGPGGTEVTVSVAGSTESVEITGGASTTVDFQYSRLVIFVLAPDNRPVSGAKVSVNGNNYETSEAGKATVELAEVQVYDIRLGDFETQVAITQPGRDVRETIGTNSSGVKASVTDSATGQSVGNTTIRVDGSGVTARTGPDGVGSSIGQDSGQITVLFGVGDRRYVKEEKVAELTRGDVAEIEVELERKNNTPTI